MLDIFKPVPTLKSTKEGIVQGLYPSWQMINYKRNTLGQGGKGKR